MMMRAEIAAHRRARANNQSHTSINLLSPCECFYELGFTLHTVIIIITVFHGYSS